MDISMKIIGIDPGQKGAIVLVEGPDVEYLLMPYVAKELDCRLIFQWIKDRSPDLVVLERQLGMAGQGRTSIFSTAKSYGELRAITEIIEAPYLTPLPSQWTKQMLEGVPGKKGDKSRNIAASRRLFPKVDMTPGRRVKPHDGIADALLLAEFGRRKLVGSK